MENYYENGKVKVIMATEENAYETELLEYDNKSEAIEWLKWELTNPDSIYQVDESDIDLDDVENCCHYDSAQGYHIITCIVESEKEERTELAMIEEEWRKPMIDEFDKDEDFDE